MSPPYLYSLGPKSPASCTRGSQEPASATLHPSIKPSQPLSEAPPGRGSRFSQAGSPVQHSRRRSESRDTGMRRARTDDVTSHSARYIDDFPSSHSMSDVHGDDDTPTYPASDAQRTSLNHPMHQPSSCQHRLAYMSLCFFHRTPSMDIQDKDQEKEQPCLHRMRCSVQVQGRLLRSVAAVVIP